MTSYYLNLGTFAEVNNLYKIKSSQLHHPATYKYKAGKVVHAKTKFYHTEHQFLRQLEANFNDFVIFVLAA